MSNTKTIREWLKTLPEPHRTQALHNCDTDPVPSVHFLRGSLKEAIKGAFVWRDTPEGHDYWRNLCRKLKNK